MIIRGHQISFTISRLSARPDRRTYTGDTRQEFSSVRPVLEIGVEDRQNFRIYYIGIGRVLLAIACLPPGYHPVWDQSIVNEPVQLAGPNLDCQKSSVVFLKDYIKEKNK